jgi:hypothetical protein
MFKNDQFDSRDFRETLSRVPDLAVIKEAADRLQKAFCKEFGVEMRYGSFHFVYHDGQLRQVEDHPKNRRFLLVSKRQFTNGGDVE